MIAPKLFRMGLIAIILAAILAVFFNREPTKRQVTSRLLSVKHNIFDGNRFEMSRSAYVPRPEFCKSGEIPPGDHLDRYDFHLGTMKSYESGVNELTDLHNAAVIVYYHCDDISLVDACTSDSNGVFMIYGDVYSIDSVQFRHKECENLTVDRQGILDNRSIYLTTK